MRTLDRKCAAACGVTACEDLVDELCVHHPVRDGDRIDVGNLHVTVVSLPGHTRCSIGFYLPEEKLLLSSETLGVYDGEQTIVPSYLIGCEVSFRSIARVKQLDISQVLSPHLGLLNPEQTAFYLKNVQPCAEQAAQTIAQILRQGGTEQDALQWFRETFYHGYVADIYPVDAMELNTGIMIELIRRELVEHGTGV